MIGRLSRRDFLKLTSAGSLVLALGWSAEACGDGDEAPEFFTPQERTTLEAAVERILPGAVAAGALIYIERLLTAFDHDRPPIFAGGPFSDRHPFPNIERGAPSDDFPDNDFERFIPLSRIRELAWRVRIFGSANVPGAEFMFESVTGHRDLYRESIGDLDAKGRDLAGTSFVELRAEQQDEALTQASPAFVGQLIEHVVEGVYAAPEYGGNAGLAGWRSSQYEGDSQPLGYSIFNAATNEYEELPERPLSTENPDEDFSGLQGDVLEFIAAITLGQGGQRFF
ncbi:MAG: gluconate 2-dehydrogenase subunit 3 family protein [Dehalococcoidia bacterium]